MVAGQQGLEYRGRGGHARGEQQAVAASLQQIEQVFGFVVRRVVRAGITAPGTVAPIRVALIGRRGMNRRYQPAGHRVDVSQGLRSSGLRIEFGRVSDRRLLSQLFEADRIVLDCGLAGICSICEDTGRE